MTLLALTAGSVLTFLPLARAEDAPSPLGSILNLFKMAPVEFPAEQYDGWQFVYGRFVFRPAMYIFEGVMLSFVLVYVFNYFYASWSNERRAEKWVDAHQEFLATQFSKPGQKTSLLTDGPDSFLFSTGRRNVQSLHTVFTFLPRQDLFQLLFTYGWTLYDLRYNPTDDVTLDFKLGNVNAAPAGNGPPMVWAIVDKDELNTIKSGRWDLTIAKTQDNPTVPKECVVMSEVADISDSILKNNAATPLLAALKDPKIIKHFKSLSITDLPLARPLGPIREKERHVILSLKLPSSSSKFANLTPLIKAVFGLIDWVEGGKFNLRPETLKKLKTAREELEKDLIKDVTEEKVKEADESKRAAKRRAEEERIAKLSAEQQRKAMEKEKKRAMRKGTTKVRLG